MRAGLFREDLYYRLRVIPIQLPPLRQRREDIRGIIQHYMHVYCEKYGRNIFMSDANMELLERYDWPGNVREVQNVVEYYVLCSEDGNEMRIDNLRRILQIDQCDISFKQDIPLFQMRDSYEKQLIESVLQKSDSAREAAKALGIYPSSLYRKIQKYNISIKDEQVNDK
jgi:transcriptional regulator with PAS, ATPase and Fis domain